MSQIEDGLMRFDTRMDDETVWLSQEQISAFSHYNIDVIVSVGCHVKSHPGMQLRIWPTQLLYDKYRATSRLADEVRSDFGWLTSARSTL